MKIEVVNKYQESKKKKCIVIQAHLERMQILSIGNTDQLIVEYQDKLNTKLTSTSHLSNQA